MDSPENDANSSYNIRSGLLSAEDQKKSRSDLRSLIFSKNKTRKYVKVKRTPRFRFRAIGRTVMNNLKWLLEDMVIDEKVSSKHPKLTMQYKGMLRIPVEKRTAEEKEALSKMMGQLQCFERYPEKVRDNLTAAATFAYFPPNRVLVAEGHPSVAMYFIISGQANVSKKMFDPGIKEIKSVDITVMTAGETFGEINILHDEPWPTTVTTHSHMEILTVNKENFQRILEEFLGEQQREITKCLNQFSYFKDWTHRTIVECCILARIVQFDNDVLIIGENCGNLENAYFIVSGSCRVIYQLQVEHIPGKDSSAPHRLRILESDTVTQDESFPLSDTVKEKERPRLTKIAEPFITGLIVHKLLGQILNELPILEPRTSETRAPAREYLVQSHFFQIANLRTGACFGIGESLDKKFILSSSHPVTLLSIPKFFLKFHNIGNIWGRVREFYNHIYPTPEVIFNLFLMDRKWKMSTMKYMESLIKVERPFTGLTSAEAPYHSRLTMDLENPIFQRINKVYKDK